MKLLLTSLLILTLTACSGWRLRGTDTTILETGSIYLTGQSSQTYQLIEQQLQKKAALGSLNSAALTLVVQDESITRRTASVTSGAVTAEYELTLTIDYRILNAAQQTLRPSRTLRIVRSYTFDQNDVAGKDKEELILRRDMQRAAARQILQQLQLLQRQGTAR